jgi:hypothetical protein
MRGKAAKAIRREIKASGKMPDFDIKGRDLRQKVSKTLLNPVTGEEIKRHTIFNMSKVAYRRLKKDLQLLRSVGGRHDLK